MRTERRKEVGEVLEKEDMDTRIKAKGEKDEK